MPALSACSFLFLCLATSASAACTTPDSDCIANSTEISRPLGSFGASAYSPVPAHIPISTGLLIFAIGFFLISVIDVNTGFWALVGYTAINRVGLSLAIPSLSAGALKAVPSEKLARGASSATFFRNLGGGFGITLLTAFFEHRAQFHSEALTCLLYTSPSPRDS